MLLEHDGSSSRSNVGAVPLNSAAASTEFETDLDTSEEDLTNLERTHRRLGIRTGHDGGIYHQAPWYERIYRRRCSICMGIVFVFFFFWWLTANDKSCRARMSEPHTSDRAFNTEPYLIHFQGDESKSDAAIKLASSHPNQEIRFLVVGNFGRDGFCYQTDVQVEMERAARTMKASFVISTGNAFFPAGLVSTKTKR